MSHAPGTRQAVLSVPGISRPVRLWVPPPPDIFAPHFTVHQQWEPVETRVFVELVQRGACVVDVGAHVGYYSVIAALRGAPVHALEPDPDNAALARANLAENRCFGARLHELAASDAPGSALLFRSPINSGDNRLNRGENGDRAVPVPRLPLDLLLADEDRPIGLMKLDTQGAEVAVLRGAAGLLKEHAKRMAILLEFWPYGLQRQGAAVEELLAILTRHGFRLAEVSEEEHRVTPLSIEQVQAMARGDFAPASKRYTTLLALGRQREAPRLQPVPALPQLPTDPAELTPSDQARLHLARSCHDADFIPKVTEAGSFVRMASADWQRMHNGILAPALGPLERLTIAELGGHLRPQQERVLRLLMHEIRGGTVVQMNGWSAYPALSCLERNAAQAVLIARDAEQETAFRRCVGVNGHAASCAVADLAGDPAGSLVLAARTLKLDRLDLVIADLPANAPAFLIGLAGPLQGGMIRFLLLATHDPAAPVPADTHRRCVGTVAALGGNVLVEVAPWESFTGVGFLAAAFGPGSETVPAIAVSRCALSESLYPDLGQMAEQPAQ